MMKITGLEDLRVQRTINGIYRAFEELICDKDYEKITVTQLAQLAQINKKTFYRYYPTLDDLLAEMQARYSQEYIETTEAFVFPRDLEKSVRAFFEYSAAQSEAYNRITCSQTYSGIRQQMIDQVMQKTWQTSTAFNDLSKWQQVALLTFVQNTSLEVYKQWIRNNRVEPLENIIESATALMVGGVTNFLKTSQK